MVYYRNNLKFQELILSGKRRFLEVLQYDNLLRVKWRKFSPGVRAC